MRCANGLLLSVAVFNAVLPAHAQQVRGFSADLAFSFYCGSDPSPERAEAAIERFLREMGFKVIDVVRLRREQKLPPLFSETMIEGIEETQRRMIYFDSTPFQTGWYTVQFYTPPPTQRDERVEGKLLMFVSETLGCRLGRRIDRRENGAGRRDHYDEFSREMRDKIREGNKEF
jgi:hypothetical protein